MSRLARKTVIIVVAAVLSGVLTIAGLAWVLVYQHAAAARAGSEAATQQNLKTIAAYQAQYFNTHSRTFGTFDQLVKEQMLTKRFSGEAPIIDDYILTLKVTPTTTNQISSYTLNADPQTVPGVGLGRYFYIDSTSAVIRVNPDRPAGPNDPPFGQ